MAVGITAWSVADAAAQGTASPPNGLNGTVATEGTVEQEYKGAHEILVKTADGVHHVFHSAKGLLVHGTSKTGEEGLADLHTGMTVVVHYSVDGGNQTAYEIDRVGDTGLAVTEGVVTRVDRAGKKITVRFDNGTTETLELTDRAAVDAGKDVAQGSRVAVYYTNEAGRKVVHYFKKK